MFKQALQASVINPFLQNLTLNSLFFGNKRTIYEQPESIRGLFGTTDTRNATHGSGEYALDLILNRL